MTAVFIDPHFAHVDPEARKRDHSHATFHLWSWVSNLLYVIPQPLSGITFYSEEAKTPQCPQATSYPLPPNTILSFSPSELGCLF